MMLATIFALSLVAAFAESQQVCDEYCTDYHRFCPYVKDKDFRQKYLDDNQECHVDNIFPPEQVDCSRGFYHYECPMSCGVCTPCAPQIPDMAAEKAAWKQEILVELGIICNPCTEIKVGETEDGKAICDARYNLEVVEEGECSCWCGQGSKTIEKECVYYEEGDDGTCQEFRSRNDSFNCRNEQLSNTEPCKLRDCVINTVFEQTSTVERAQTNDDIFYKAYTNSNEVCDLGVVGAGQYRENGGSYTHDVNFACDACMKSASEVFDHVDLRIDGDNAWVGDYIKVTVNGNDQEYYSKVYDSEHFMKDGNTASFVKSRGVAA